MANMYNPIGSMAPIMGFSRNTREGGPDDREERERERPEIPPPPPAVPVEAPPELPGEPGAPAPGPGEPGGPGVSMPAVGAGNPFLQPGGPGARAFRTPAFFTNRYVGGFQDQPMRAGAGAPMAAQQRPPLDEATMRMLVERFRGVQ